MKSSVFKVFLVTGVFLLSALSSHEAKAKPGVCDYDCDGHSKTRYACGVKITWKSQSIKWCESVNIPVRIACEAVRATACKVGGALDESGPDGPHLHYERFQMLPYKSVFKEDVVMMARVAEKLVDWANMQGLSTPGMTEFKRVVSYVDTPTGSVIMQQIQALDDWAKWAGIVCTEDDYAKLKNNVPYYYLKQIPMADFCKKRWQHLSNNWANGFERNRNRAECEAKWALQGFEHGPLTFTCANRMPSYEAFKRDIDAATAADFEAYAQGTTASMEEFLRSVNWSQTDEVKAAQKEVSKADTDLFESAKVKTEFEAQLSEVNRLIEVQEAYKRELEAKLGRIMGFIESYKTFVESESAKIDALELKFTKMANDMKVALDERSQKIAQLQLWIAQVQKTSRIEDGQALTDIGSLQTSYESLQKGTYQDVCVSDLMRIRLAALQGVQAYRMDLADRLVSSIEYFEDSAEFNEAKQKFTDQATKLSSKVSEKNYVFDDKYQELKQKPTVCADFERSRSMLDTLAQTVRETGNANQIQAIRSDFLVRLDALKAQQRILEQKTSVRNTVYTIMKNLEDNFNSGYLTQVYKEQVTARKRILAAGDFAKSVLKAEDLKSIQTEVDLKLAYFDQRSVVYTDLQQGRLKLQNRLNRFINDLADFKDQSDEGQLKVIADDVESFLPVPFNYNADRVTAVLPAVANVSELSGFDALLTDVEQRFLAVKEASK